SALGGVCQAVTIANIVRQYQGTTLIVTSDTPSALSLELELNYLLSKSAIKVRLFPDRETLPYDSFSPHQDLISQRLETLSHISQAHHSVVIVPVSTLMVRLPPKAYLSANVFVLKKGDKYPLQRVRQHLIDTGYHLVEQVYEHGEFAIRGAILDLFPTGVNMPLRIELFDDEVDTIRHFDAETQRSLHPVDAVRLLPAKEFPTDSGAIEGFRQRYRRRFEVIVKEPESVYQQVSRNLMPAGIENYLPLFFEEVASLFDYLPPSTQLVTLGDIEKAARSHLHEVETRYQDRRVDPLRPLLAPKELYLLIEELFAAFKPLGRYQLNSPELSHAKAKMVDAALLPDLSANHKLKQPLLAL
ncbi:MAG: transcription-repair coupling factor, partial [Shewanella sp.]